MPIVNVMDLADDDILLSNALDAAGEVVARAGAQTTAQIKRILVKAGVRRVNIAARSGAERLGAGTTVLKKPDTVMMEQNLLRLARMFNRHRDDPLMRELCRLAIKCAQERLISV